MKKEQNFNKTKRFSIFDWLKEIMVNKRPWSTFNDEDRKSFEPFMINRFLSMNRDYLEIVDYVQFIPYSEKEKYYNIYREFIPKKFTFSKYIKGSKKETNKDVLEKISQYYECSLIESESYIDFLGKDGVEEILVKLGIDTKEQKKLLKEV